ncbi:MAG: cob(I)yrinic acid a,c-diamide adenosyltransferase [Alphaproteobacteria bacterium]
MVKLTRIYTRGGDKGETSLVSGDRVPKHDLRVAAFGTVDETNAVIGLVRLHTTGDADALLGRIQDDLFDLGADLGNPSEDMSDASLRIVAAQVTRLEQEIDAMNADLSPLTSFVLPGGTPAAAYLHQARTVCRRAERLATELAAVAPINPEAVRYLNRLSDLFFVAARYLNDKGAGDILWRPGANR